jgi:REP element-mobilizing transposase RayT
LTTRIRAGLPSLRQARAHALLVRTLRAGSERFGFRLIEYSVQSNHFHMLVEVTNREALTRGAKGILVRLAKQLNRLWGRAGQVFPDRYHVRELTTPTQVRRALAYVLHNARRHGALGRGIDPFSSAPWFEGFAGRRPALDEAVAATDDPVRRVDRIDERGSAIDARLRSLRGSRPATVLDQMQHWPRATCRARCWLLRSGWQRIGLIRIDEQVLAWAEPR